MKSLFLAPLLAVVLSSPIDKPFIKKITSPVINETKTSFDNRNLTPYAKITVIRARVKIIGLLGISISPCATSAVTDVAVYYENSGALLSANYSCPNDYSAYIGYVKAGDWIQPGLRVLSTDLYIFGPKHYLTQAEIDAGIVDISMTVSI